MVTDPISDYLTRIRNAQMRKRQYITVPSTKTLISLSDILKDEGFIEDFREEKSEDLKNRKEIKIKLRYIKGNPAIKKLERVSKPGVRKYIGYRGIPRILGGLGILILTTSKGVMSGEEARKEKVGGEFICRIW